MRYLLALVLAIASAPSFALAQGVAIENGLTMSIGPNKQTSSDLWIYLNARDCAEDPEIKFKITNVLPEVARNLEIWHGPENTARTVPANGISECTRIPSSDYKFDQSLSPGITISVRKLLSGSDAASVDEADGGVADEGNGACSVTGRRWLYILSPTTPSTPNNPEEVTDNSSFRVKLEIDLNVPAAPTSLSTDNGESQVVVKWSGPSDVEADMFKRYHVYYDPMPFPADEECASTALVAGQKAPDSDNYESLNVETLSTSPGTLGLEDNDTQVAVAVTAFDAARNESVLSEVVCVAKVETTGFYDACKADSDCKLDKCSAAPWGKAAGALSVVVMIACSAAFVRRRRRNV
jgi:hypothetical protein